MVQSVPPPKASSTARGEALFHGLFLSALLLFVAAVSALILTSARYVSLDNWVAAMTRGRSEVWFAVRLSLITSAITLVAALLVGLPSAYALSRVKLPCATLFDTLLDLPIVLPPPVIGLCLLIVFGRTGLDRWLEANFGHGLMYEPWGIPLAQFFVAAAFGIRALKAAFDSINPRLEHVARSLGCTSWQAFWRVSLPLARNGLIAGAIMTWARAVSEFGPILFFCGATPRKTEVLPISMFLNFSSGNIERAMILALLMVAMGAVTLVTFKKLGGKGYLW